MSKKSDKEYLKQLGNNIYMLRKSQKVKMTQSYLGKLIGVHQHVTIGRIERGEENCTILTLKKIANALGVSVGDLLNIEA